MMAPRPVDRGVIAGADASLIGGEVPRLPSAFTWIFAVETPKLLPGRYGWSSMVGGRQICFPGVGVQKGVTG